MNKKSMANKKIARGFKTKSGFVFPSWMECGWRRKLCNKKECPLCGRILKNRKKHLEKGEDPDNLKCVLEDVGSSLKEVLKIIKKDADRMGVNITNIDSVKEPPQPKKFPLYKKINHWRETVFKIADYSKNSSDLWIYTEAAADLFWYANTITTKIYRQLCNRWEMKHGDEYGEFDYEYTQYVLTECLRILKTSINTLAMIRSNQKGELMILLAKLSQLEKDILSI